MAKEVSGDVYENETTSAKNAILKAKIFGVITELLVKTTAANVYVDDTTTLAAKLASIATDIAAKASTTELENLSSSMTTALAGKSDVGHVHDASTVTYEVGVSVADALGSIKGDISGINTSMSGKANASHTHSQSEVTGLNDALALLASKTAVSEAIDALRQEMLGDTPVEAYNTFTELAAYIAEHKEVSDALSAAIAGKANVEHTHAIADVTGLQDALDEVDGEIADINTALGNKADKATTLAGYGIADAYTSTQTDAKIADALANATGGESAADVKLALETYETNNDARVAALEADSHTHSNKDVLDGISADLVATWNGKSDSKIYYSAIQPSNLTENDLWVQLV